MENWLLIYNPASGGGKRAKAALDGIIETFQRKDKFITTYRLDRTTPSTIREVLEAGKFDGVLVCGGDGSVKSVGGLFFGRPPTFFAFARGRGAETAGAFFFCAVLCLTFPVPGV